MPLTGDLEKFLDAAAIRIAAAMATDGALPSVIAERAWGLATALLEARPHALVEASNVVGRQAEVHHERRMT